MTLDRRTFFARSALGAGAVSIGAPALARAESDAPRMPASEFDVLPQQDPALVREIVGKSHFDLEGVKALVERQPELAKASYDWGFGDW